MPRERTRVRVVISGRVQGVAFRDSTRRMAERLGLGGWVRNLSDGRVEAAFEGPAAEVERAVAWCREGPPGARVTAAEPHPEEPADESAFQIRRTDYTWKNA